MCDVQFTLPRYCGSDCIAFIRFAWQDCERTVRENCLFEEAKSRIVAAIKRAYPDAFDNIREIKTDNDLILLRNSVKPRSIVLHVFPDVKVDSLAEKIDNNNVPIINLHIYSCTKLTDSYGNPDFETNRLHTPVFLNNHDWEGFREVANFANSSLISVEQMMDSAMPRLRYPLTVDEIHVGDYFYTDFKTISKVKRIEGQVVTMENDFMDDYHLLRPVPVVYLNLYAIKGCQGYNEILRESINFFGNESSPHQYAHQFQHIARSYNESIDIPLNKQLLAEDNTAFISFRIHKIIHL